MYELPFRMPTRIGKICDRAWSSQKVNGEEGKIDSTPVAHSLDNFVARTNPIAGVLLVFPRYD